MMIRHFLPTFSFLTSRQRRRLRSVFLTKTVYPSQHVQGILFHIQILIQQIFKVSSFGIVKPLTILSISPQTAMIVESCIRPDGVSFIVNTYVVYQQYVCLIFLCRTGSFLQHMFNNCFI